MLLSHPRLQNNGLQMIVRAHECVMDGFERFAQGHLITLFSATNYCGTAGRQLLISATLTITIWFGAACLMHPSQNHSICTVHQRGARCLHARLAPALCAVPMVGH